MIAAPDWSLKGTAARLEDQLTGFKFKGPGFYIGQNEWMLVVPFEGTSLTWDSDTLFQAYMYTGSFAESALAYTLPVREDAR